MVRIVRKESNLRFCIGLTSSEFACNCVNESCKVTIITNKLIKAYKNFRELIGVKLKVNCGYRCPLHNFNTPNSSALSRHMTGQAIDISLKTIDHLSLDDIEFAAKKAGFTFVKFYKTFVHLDVR